MSLGPGTRLGAYEIVAKLGEGGMGQVYQARDTKLNRNVAVKILPSALAGDPDRLARFKREAQLLASLNHPNIAIIHGFEDSGETHALIMELVPGRTLAEVISGGASRGLTTDEALPIAHQIASALEAAHEQGVVHRDLKPSNIKVTDDGTVKVLDFGLAKLSGPEAAANTAAATAQTSTSPALTEMGVILGTAAYMSPEQARGKVVDRRADIWAFGVVLFEVLAGKALFAGDTVNETIANVITQPPDLNALPETTPGSVRRVLRRCLEKDPRSRYQSAGDLRIEIEEILSGVPVGDSGPLVQTAMTTPAPTSAWRRWLPWGLAAVLLVALVYAARPGPAPSGSPVKFEVSLGTQDLFVDENIDGPIIVPSPDGSSIVYLGTTAPSRRLFIRELARLDSREIPGTEGAQQQFFSPDGRSLAFFLEGGLVRMPIDGGVPTTLAQAVDARGGSWGPDDSIVFSPSSVSGLWRVPAAGGTAKEVTTLLTNERTHRWPWFLPGGKAVLFICQLANGSYDNGTIEAVRLDTGERKVLVRGGTFPRYVESGHLIYSRENTVYAVAFDSERLEVRGEPQPVLTGVFATGTGVGAGVGNGGTQIAISSNGTAVYLPGQPQSDSALKLAVSDRTGTLTYQYPELRSFRDPAFSRDGRRILVRVGDGRSAEHVHVLDPARDTLTKLVFEGGFSGVPVPSPDNEHMAFASDRGGQALSVYIVRSDGTGQVTPIGASGPLRIPTSFSPDGRHLAISQVNPRTNMDLMVASVQNAEIKPFLASPENEMMGVFSPDGRWMAYQAGDGGASFDVFVRSFPDAGALRQVSNNGGLMPRWTRGGRELVYLSGTQAGVAMMSVEVSPEGQALTLGKPTELFRLPIALRANALSFDASPDGNRFVMMLTTTGAKASPVRTHATIVLNFFDDIRRATAGK